MRVRKDGIEDTISFAVVDGRKTVTTAGTAEQFTAQACHKVRIQALQANTDVVAIGASTVVAASGTERGTILYTGQYADFEVSNMDVLYIDSAVNGEGVAFIAFL